MNLYASMFFARGESAEYRNSLVRYSIQTKEGMNTEPVLATQGGSTRSLCLLRNLTLSVIILAQLINALFVTLFGTSGILALIYIAATFVLVVDMLLHGFKRRSRMTFLLLGVLLVFEACSSLIYGGMMRGSIFELIIYSFLPFLLLRGRRDASQVVRFNLYISAFGLLCMSQLMVVDQNNSIEMGLSYALLPSILSAFLFLKNDRRFNVGTVLGLIASAFFLVYEVAYGTRGVILSLLVFFALLLLVKFDANGKMIHEKIGIRNIALFCAFLALALFFAIADLSSIVESAYYFLYSMGLDLEFLSKTAYLISQGDLDNGRSGIYEIAWQGIMQSPIFGHGINMFEANTGIHYPHNLFLQLLYDGGLLMFLPVVVSLIAGLICVFRYSNANDFALFVLLFTCSIPRLMVSANLWETIYFWLLMAFLMEFRDRKLRRGDAER